MYLDPMPNLLNIVHAEMTPHVSAPRSHRHPEDGTGMADIEMSQLSRVAEVLKFHDPSAVFVSKNSGAEIENAA